MSVSYYQLMYSESDGKFERVSDRKSAPIYKLCSLSQGDHFKQFVKEQYDYELYDFASGKNLIEESGLPPLSTKYLPPDDILQDLEYYKKLLNEIIAERKNHENGLLANGIRLYFIDEPTISQIEYEIRDLESVCMYANEKGYFIKFACDY